MNGNGIIAWLALVIAVIALALGWIAYNRTGVDLEQQIQAAAREAAEEVNQEAREAEMEARQETGETLQNAGEELQEQGQDASTEDQREMQQ